MEHDDCLFVSRRLLRLNGMSRWKCKLYHRLDCGTHYEKEFGVAADVVILVQPVLLGKL